MAQIGSRLIDSTAKKLAGEFFAKFNELVSTETEEEQSEAIEAPLIDDTNQTDEKAAVTDASEPEKAGWMKPSLLVPAAIVVVLALYFLTKGA